MMGVEAKLDQSKSMSVVSPSIGSRRYKLERVSECKGAQREETRWSDKRTDERTNEEQRAQQENEEEKNEAKGKRGKRRMEWKRERERC